MTQTKFVHNLKTFYDLCRSNAVEKHGVHAVVHNAWWSTQIHGMTTMNKTLEATSQLPLSRPCTQDKNFCTRRRYYFFMPTQLFLFRCKKAGDHYQTPPKVGIINCRKADRTLFVLCPVVLKLFIWDQPRVNWNKKVKGMTQNRHTENTLELNEALVTC